MTATLLQIAQAAEDPDFRSRVKAAVFITAGKILSTPGNDPAAVSRRYLASSASGSAETLVWQFAWLIASSGAIAATISTDENGQLLIGADDPLLLAACSAAWDVVAGITR